MKPDMDFGQALAELKNGYRVARKGWNGAGMHIFLEEDFRVLDQETVVFEPCIVMFTAQGKYQPGWLASQADLLAEDWQVVKWI